MKTVIVTGASSGIGKALAKEFHDKGWFVLLLARNQERLQAVHQALPNSHSKVCDLTQPNQVAELKDFLAQQNGPIKALINNAGVYQPQTLDQDSDENWDHHFQNNLMSAVRMTRLAWPHLKQNKGCVLNISSTLAIRPIVNTAAYSALKAAMNNWTLSLALDGAPFGIRANSICPGIIDTPIHSYFGSQRAEDKELHQSLQKIQPLGRTGQPEDICPLAQELCSEGSAWVTGNIISVDGGILLNS
jgi:NAD(P)-dependent dehydrogenase (short-subunit alcohol dehydrogenase family)